MNKCPICSSEYFELIYTNSRGNKPLNNYCCKNCGFVFVLPRLNNEQINALYTKGEFSKKARNHSSPDLKKYKQTEVWALERIHLLEQKIPTFFSQKKTCIEIGSGASSFSWLLQSRGHVSEALEPDVNYANSAKERYNLLVHQLLLENFNRDNTYEFISSFHVIEHIVDPVDFLNHIYRILKQEGVLYIECPTIDEIYTNDLDTFFWDVHLNTFSNVTLPFLLEKTGFEVIEVFNHKRFLACLARKVNNPRHRYKEDNSQRIKSIIHKFGDSSQKVKNSHINNSNFKNITNRTILYSLNKISNVTYRLQKRFETDKKSNKNLNTNNLPTIKTYITTRKNKISHISSFSYGNAGDTLLPIALRDLWHLIQDDITWESKHISSAVTAESIDQINQTKGLIIGGGGLFLKDTNPNNLSGWQWPCSDEMLEKIKVPIILFAVGYNRFRGQDDFDPVFTKSIQGFAKKAEYIGLRNFGSINAIKNYLPENLHDKLRYQPCMTTYLAQLYPTLCDYSNKENFVAINAAFDRSHLRFGANIGKILSAIAKTAKKLSNYYPIKFYSHMISDEAFIPFLQSYNVKYELVRLINVHPSEIIKAYARPKLAIGMRGHAQMIPFGCNTPVISIVSHNKMQWFLDDIEQPAWGADVLSNTFEKELLSKSIHSLEQFDHNMTYIKDKQVDLYNLSLKNVEVGLNSMNLTNGLVKTINHTLHANT